MQMWRIQLGNRRFSWAVRGGRFIIPVVNRPRNFSIIFSRIFEEVSALPHHSALSSTRVTKAANSQLDFLSFLFDSAGFAGPTGEGLIVQRWVELCQRVFTLIHFEKPKYEIRAWLGI